MKGMKSLLTIFAVFAFVAISSSAFALGNPYTNESSNWDVTPSAKALAAASSYVYDQDYLQAVNSDAGADIIPSAKAAAAAKYYQYDSEKLIEGISDGATEHYFAGEHQSAEVDMIVNRASENSLICTSC